MYIQTTKGGYLDINMQADRQTDNDILHNYVDRNQSDIRHASTAAMNYEHV